MMRRYSEFMVTLFYAVASDAREAAARRRGGGSGGALHGADISAEGSIGTDPKSRGCSRSFPPQIG